VESGEALLVGKVRASVANGDGDGMIEVNCSKWTSNRNKGSTVGRF